MPVFVMTIDNTPLSRLTLDGAAGATGATSGWPPGGELRSLAALPQSLGPSEGLLINSSVADFSRLPPCPYDPEQVAILVSALTPLSRPALAELGYRHLIDKDHGFAALCHAVRHWRTGLSQLRQPREPRYSQALGTLGAEPELVERLRAELTALIDAKLLRAEGEIHAHLEQVVLRWLSQSAGPKITAHVDQQLGLKLPELVTSALATELDRLTGRAAT